MAQHRLAQAGVYFSRYMDQAGSRSRRDDRSVVENRISARWMRVGWTDDECSGTNRQLVGCGKIEVYRAVPRK
jgi:hypothetical protein